MYLAACFWFRNENEWVLVELKHMEGLLGLFFQASELISMFVKPHFSNKLDLLCKFLAVHDRGNLGCSF